MTARVGFRVDASVVIGTGHLMRCLTLAGHLRRLGTEVFFISAPFPGHLFEHVERQGFTVVRLDEASSVGDPAPVAALELDLLVIDHYGIGVAEERDLRRAAPVLTVIDDVAGTPHDADLLINQNVLGDDGTSYDVCTPPGCEKLLGPHFALLREEFAIARRRARRESVRVQRLLVSYGGSDPSNETAKALQAVAHLDPPGLEVDVVIGPSNPRRAALEEQAATLPGARCHVATTDMATLMAEADLSLGAGGSSTWERLCLGLPSIVTVCAEHQRAYVEELERRGCLRSVGFFTTVNPEMLREALVDVLRAPQPLVTMSAAGMALVDGRGAERVATRVVNLAGQRAGA